MDDTEAEKIATKYPGHINFSGQVNGHYSGAKALEFLSADEFNTYFEAHPHVIVTYVAPTPTGILVIYTTQLDERDLRYLSDWNEKAENYLASRRAGDDADEIRQAEVDSKVKEEIDRLAALGRHCEHNHPKSLKEGKKQKQLKDGK